MVTSAYCGQLPVNGGHIGFQCNMTENWILWSDSEWTITPEYQSSGLSYDNKLLQNAISCCWRPYFIPRSCDLIKFTSIWFLIIDYIYTSIYTDLNQANLLQRAINYHENSFFYLWPRWPNFISHINGDFVWATMVGSWDINKNNGQNASCNMVIQCSIVWLIIVM